MRRDLQAVGPEVPAHVALAYDAWAPVDPRSGKVQDGQRLEWLGRVAQIPVAADYPHAFARWRESLGEPGDEVWELQAESRLLVGHGHPSATDVGLTVQHTWGVPVVPGSSLKGLLAHYVDAVFGPDDPKRPPWEQPEGERERAAWQGPTWAGRRIRWGPGALYRELFGAPEAEGDDDCRRAGLSAGARAGRVFFHDAWYVPGSARTSADAADTPFAPDVLTVHQKNYYRTEGGEGWPNDYDDPNPVSFLTVRPGVRLLFALSGPGPWTALARRLLTEALSTWGVGGKTSSGYGRFEPVQRAEGASAGRQGAAMAAEPSAPAHHRKGDTISVTRIEDPKGKGRVLFRADDGWTAQLDAAGAAIAVGERMSVWVTNVGHGVYTVSLRPPKSPGGRPRGRA
jgi:CRISPR-associated protein Cmr6